MKLPKIGPPKINIQIQHVVEKTRTLGATWTVEVPQEFDYTINPILEDELAAMIAKEFGKAK